MSDESKKPSDKPFWQKKSVDEMTDNEKLANMAIWWVLLMIFCYGFAWIVT